MNIVTGAKPTADTNLLANLKLNEIPIELAKLASDLGLQPKQKMIALVEKVSSITLEERSLIMQLKREGGTSALAMKNWDKTLNDPNLKHIELKISQKTIQTLTTVALTKGQELKIELTHLGLKLTTDSLIQSQKAQAISSAQAQKLNASGNSAKIDETISPSLKNTDSLNVQRKLNTQHVSIRPATQFYSTAFTRPPETEIALREALSKTLPLSEPHQKLFNTIEKLTNQLNVFVSKNPRNSVNDQLRQFSQMLSISARSPSLHISRESPPPSSAIEQAIKNSGAFYEQKIAKLASPPIINSTASQNHRPASTSTTPDATLKPSMRPTLETPSRSIDQDLKGLLIQLSTWLLSNSAVPKSAEVKPKVDDAVAKLLQSLFQIITPRQSISGNKANVQTLSQELQKLVQQSLARVQVQQYKTLNSQTQETTSTAAAALHFDVPVKTPDGYINIYFQIFEPKTKEDQKSSKDMKESKTRSKWRLYMELELEDDGNLAVELSICDKKINAVFWAEKDELRQKTEAQIEQLRNDLESKGLEVTDLRCSTNAPPNQKMHMGYSLIDVKT